MTIYRGPFGTGGLKALSEGEYEDLLKGVGNYTSQMDSYKDNTTFNKATLKDCKLEGKLLDAAGNELLVVPVDLMERLIINLKETKDRLGVLEKRMAE